MKHYGRSIQRETWTAQAKYRFRTLEAKRYRGRDALEAMSLGDLLDAQHPTYDGGIEQIDLKQCVTRTLETLTPREETILRRVFGLGCEPETMAEIARAAGRCHDTISKVYQKAIRKLRHPARTRLLAAFRST